jgi:hypothetical protein
MNYGLGARIKPTLEMRFAWPTPILIQTETLAGCLTEEAAN